MSVSVNKSDQLQLGEIPAAKPVATKAVLTPLQRLFLLDNHFSPDNSSTESNPDAVDKNAVKKEGSESGSASSESRKGEDRSRSRDKVAPKKREGEAEKKRLRGNRKKKNEVKQVIVSSVCIDVDKKQGEQPGSVSSVLQTPTNPSKDARQNYLQIKQAFSGLFQENQQPPKPPQPSHDRFYKTKFCPQYQEGYCERGLRCTFAHGEAQLRPLEGVLYKTKICFSFERGTCMKGKHCGYAHGMAELRESKKQSEDSHRNREKSQQKKRQNNGRNQSNQSQRNGNNTPQKNQKMDFNQNYTMSFPPIPIDKQTGMPLYPPNYFAHFYPPNGAYMPPQLSQSSQGFPPLPEGYPNYYLPYYPYYPPQGSMPQSMGFYPPFTGLPIRNGEHSPNNLPGGTNDPQGRLQPQRRGGDRRDECERDGSPKLVRE